MRDDLETDHIQISPLFPPVRMYFPLGQTFIRRDYSWIVWMELVFSSFTMSIILIELSIES
jgi:hypothetical protein